MNFSKPMFIRSTKQAQSANKGRNLEEVDIDVNDAVTVNIEGAQDEYDLDKSIVNVRVKKSSETEVSLQIDFSDTNAISTEIAEPDVLIIKFDDPGIFID